MYEISAIVLAAGFSKRMPKKNKLFEKFHTKFLLQHVIDELVLCELMEILLIHQKSDNYRLNQLIPEKVHLVENPFPEKGMTYSIQKGVERTNKNSKGLMICLGDMPFVKKKDYEWLMTMFQMTFESNAKAIIVPTHRGKRGNPVIFSYHYRQEILENQEPDGCKNIIRSNHEHVVEVEIDHSCILIDIDTEEELAKWKRGYT